METEDQVVVARAEITDTVEIHAEAPETLRVPAGKRFLVKFPYKFIEASPEQEHYRFTLAAALGPYEPDEAVAEWGDRRGLPDERWGYVYQEFHAPESGEHELRFRARAEYTVGEWGGEPETQEDAEVSGSVRLVAV